MQQEPSPQPRPGPLCAPGPINVAIGQFLPTGQTEHLIAVTVDSVTGTYTFFMPAELAEEVGKAIIANARNARTGLIVPEGAIAPISLPQQPKQN